MRIGSLFLAGATVMAGFGGFAALSQETGNAPASTEHLGAETHRNGSQEAAPSETTAQAGGGSATEDQTGQTAADQRDLHPEAQLNVAEEHVTITLEPGGPHRVYVLDPVFPHLTASKIWVYDGDTGDLLGMMNAGYVPNMAIAPDHSQLFVAETYWSRGTRGNRTDVVTFYDPKTLSPTGEVELPQGRFLVVPKRHDADVSPDGRYLYSFNLAPLTSVSVIDLEAQSYMGEVEIPGCALVFPTGERRFSSLCSDGSLLSASFDESLEAQISRSEPFFDAENDPVFEHAGFDRADNVLHMITYSGQHYAADLSGDAPSVSEAWDFVGDEGRAENWRPGGWQLMSYHQGNDRLYVIMHQGGDWTHKAAGHEVWELDPAAQEVVRRIELEEEAFSIAVTRDESPLLVALSEAASVVTYDLETAEPRARMEGIGDSPFLVMVEGN